MFAWFGVILRIGTSFCSHFFMYYFKFLTQVCFLLNQLKELYTLLNENYVEDDDNMFRFDYSPDFLLW